MAEAVVEKAHPGYSIDELADAYMSLEPEEQFMLRDFVQGSTITLSADKVATGVNLAIDNPKKIQTEDITLASHPQLVLQRAGFKNLKDFAQKVHQDRQRILATQGVDTGSQYEMPLYATVEYSDKTASRYIEETYPGLTIEQIGFLYLMTQHPEFTRPDFTDPSVIDRARARHQRVIEIALIDGLEDQEAEIVKWNSDAVLDYPAQEQPYRLISIQIVQSMEREIVNRAATNRELASVNGTTDVVVYEYNPGREPGPMKNPPGQEEDEESSVHDAPDDGADDVGSAGENFDEDATIKLPPYPDEEDAPPPDWDDDEFDMATGDTEEILTFADDDESTEEIVITDPNDEDTAEYAVNLDLEEDDEDPSQDSEDKRETQVAPPVDTSIYDTGESTPVVVKKLHPTQRILVAQLKHQIAKQRTHTRKKDKQPLTVAQVNELRDFFRRTLAIPDLELAILGNDVREALGNESLEALVATGEFPQLEAALQKKQ